MKCVPHELANRVLVAPDENPSEKEIYPIAVWTDGQECISAWLPTPEELEDLMAGKPLYLRMLSGQTQAPVALQTEFPWPWERRDDGVYELRRADGSIAATVWPNGTWFTWGRDGVGGENDVADCRGNAILLAGPVAVRQGFFP